MEEEEEESQKEDDTSSGGNSEVATPPVTLSQARPNLCTRPFMIDNKRLW